MYDHQTTVQLIESRFPNLAADLHDEIADGLLHIQVGVFARFAQSAIDSRDGTSWDQVVDAFMCLWGNCAPDVENALNVSFLEYLNFNDGKSKRSWAYDEMEAYNRKIHGS